MPHRLTALLGRLGWLIAAASVSVFHDSYAANHHVYLTYHWHLHQPIYWPENAPGTNHYQYAEDSIGLKFGNQGNYYAGSNEEHPTNHLWDGDGGQFDAVFSKADRINAYQFGGRDSIATMGNHANAGASVSYSGSLQENIASLGRAGRSYAGNWNDGYKEARGWLTGSGHPKADMIGITYHHSFSPLLPKSVLRKEIQIFKEIWWKNWGGNPDKSDHSKGFWPVECAFSRHMIPILMEEGYAWSIVANSHLARTCANYMDVAQRGTSGWNIDPPNRADRLGPSVPAHQWWGGQIDGRGGLFPAPYAYQAHRAQYIDPATGQEQLLTIVPMCDLLSYQNGFSTMGTGDIENEIAAFADGPVIVLMAHDGDNAWGGGSSYYFESVPGLMNEAAGKGMNPSTIEHFLEQVDINNLSVVHIEDGAWVNAANDWGHPQFINWLWPPARDPASPGYDFNDPRTWYDLETPGWAEDWRNWAVLMAATNYLETAEQMWTDGGGEVAAWRIQEPTQPNGTDNNPNFVEQGWHYFLGGLDSGFMYYGTSLDDEVKQTLASNRALERPAPSDGSLKDWVDARKDAEDATPPTVFKPQRFPWNPGGRGWGPTTGYRAIGFDGQAPWPSDFHIWTHVFDVSGVQRVTLKVRVDNDGINPMDNHDNETYAGGSSVGDWIDIDMTVNRRVLSKTYNGNNATINFFLTPHVMADYYWAKVSGYKDKLLDYYIEAEDTEGNIHKSDIQHVYVEDDGAVTTPPGTPQNLAANATSASSIELTWDSVNGATGYTVSRGGSVISSVSTNGYTDNDLNPETQYCYTVTASNAAGISAASPQACATTQATGNGGDPEPETPFQMDGIRDADGYLQTAPGMTLYAALRGKKLYVATWAAGGGEANGSFNDHFIFVANELQPEAATIAPWGKAGLVAVTPDKPYLAAESTNDFIGWFNVNGSSNHTKNAGTDGQMEGVLDLGQHFGANLPPVLYLAAVAYQTGDDGELAAQAPAGNSDNNLDPAEFFAIPVTALKDDNADGLLDRLDPLIDFTMRAAPAVSGGSVTLAWTAVPGRTYNVHWTAGFNQWNDAPDGTGLVAGPGVDMMSYTYPDALSGAVSFRISVEQ